MRFALFTFIFSLLGASSLHADVQVDVKTRGDWRGDRTFRADPELRAQNLALFLQTKDKCPSRMETRFLGRLADQGYKRVRVWEDAHYTSPRPGVSFLSCQYSVYALSRDSSDGSRISERTREWKISVSVIRGPKKSTR
jgi:hypothetical protein